MLVECCINQVVQSFDLEPIKGYVDARLLVLDECKICKKHLVLLVRQTPKGRWEFVKYENKKARDFFERIKYQIIGKSVSQSSENGGRFYLNYTDKGAVKRCYSNLSSLKIGLLDNFRDLKFNSCTF